MVLLPSSTSLKDESFTASPKGKSLSELALTSTLSVPASIVMESESHPPFSSLQTLMETSLLPSANIEATREFAASSSVRVTWRLEKLRVKRSVASELLLWQPRF